MIIFVLPFVRFLSDDFSSQILRILETSRNFTEIDIFDLKRRMIIKNNFSRIKYCHSIKMLMELITPADEIESINEPVMKGAGANIEPRLEQLPILQEVKNKALEISKRLNRSTKRGSKLNQLIFMSISYAHDELDIPCDPKRLAQIIGMKQNEINKARSTYSEVQTGYKPILKKKEACDLIPRYCEYLNLTADIIVDIQEFGKSIISKRPTLNEKFPQNVAAGIILCYLTLNGITIDKKLYSELVILSEVTIINMSKQIASIHNS